MHLRARPAFSLALAVFALLALALAACGRGGPPQAGGPPGGPGGMPPLPVQVAAVLRGTVPLEVQAVGSLRSPLTTEVAADVPGVIVELDVPEGREVPKGHLLARLDPDLARAALEVAEARAENARIAFERAKQLFEDEVAPRQQLDDAEAELRTATGLLEEARTALEKTEIRAPFAGQLGIQRARLGQRLGAGDPIVRITQLDPLELTFTVPEEQAGTVGVGQTVSGRVGRCGEAFTGRIAAVDPVIDPATRTLPVLARVRNPQRRLRPGMSARVRVQIGERSDALVIPHEALVRQGTRYVVWVLADDDTAQPQPVEAGAFFVDGVEITGVPEGTRVVVAGHQKLRPGAAVQPAPWQPTENPLLALGGGADAECE